MSHIASSLPHGSQQAPQAPGWQGIFDPSKASGPSLTLTRTKVRGLQRVFGLFDDSGSMRGAKAAATNVAGNTMLDHLADAAFRDGFLVTLITFDDTATVHADHARPSTLQGKAAVSGRGGTDIHVALLEANRLRRAWVPDASMHEVAPPVYVAMSDGCSVNRKAAMQEADLAKQDGVTIVTVAFGDDADQGFLQRLASSPEHFKLADSAQALQTFFAQVGATLRETQRTGAAPASALAQGLRNVP